MNSPRRALSDPLFFALIGIAELFIFFNAPRHFFMGDTLLWMGYRYHSIAQFLTGFVQVDPSSWYRPLTQRTVESLLYPFAGLNPIPYRIAVFILFFSCTIAVFLVTERITGNRRAAWIAMLFFAPHVTNTFTTYDTAFVPEMAYTLFFAGSVIAYVGYLRTNSRRALYASIALFIGSLMSKETAIGLPLILFVVWLFLPQKGRARIRSLAPHFLVLAVYLVFAIGFLHIRSINFQQLTERPESVGSSGYQLVIGNNVLESSGLAFSWAFGIRRGAAGQWQPAGPALISSLMIATLRVIRLTICAAAIVVLFTAKRSPLLIGVAWFLIAVAPTLPLVNHFFPYYLFGPLVGLSLAVGAVLDWAYEWCAKFSTSWAFALCALMLSSFAVINAAESRVAAHHFLTGGSAESALDGMKDIRALHPDLPSGTTMLIFDEEIPGLSWSHARGMLFQMAYRDESLRAGYYTDGYPLMTEVDRIKQGKSLVFKLARGHLMEITPFVKQRPELLLPHVPGECYRLELSKSEVRAGKETYVMRIPEIQNTTVNIMRAYNGIVEDPYSVELDSKGEAELEFGSDARPGTYTFVAVRRRDEPNWVTVSGTIRVNE